MITVVYAKQEQDDILCKVIERTKKKKSKSNSWRIKARKDLVIEVHAVDHILFSEGVEFKIEAIRNMPAQQDKMVLITLLGMTRCQKKMKVQLLLLYILHCQSILTEPCSLTVKSHNAPLTELSTDITKAHNKLQRKQKSCQYFN